MITYPFFKYLVRVSFFITRIKNQSFNSESKITCAAGNLARDVAIAKPA